MSLFEKNAEVLRWIARDGSDLGPPRSVDFSHLFPDQASAEAFAREAEREGFNTMIQNLRDEPEEEEPLEDPWDVTASKVMVPSCENITETEERLSALAQTHGGRSDGWGFFHK